MAEFCKRGHEQSEENTCPGPRGSRQCRLCRVSDDPVKRERQLSGLDPQGALRHGAYSEARLAPLRDGFLARLRGEWGDVAVGDELGLQAHRLALIASVNDWLDEPGGASPARKVVRDAIQIQLQAMRDADRCLGAWRARRPAASAPVTAASGFASRSCVWTLWAARRSKWCCGSGRCGPTMSDRTYCAGCGAALQGGLRVAGPGCRVCSRPFGPVSEAASGDDGRLAGWCEAGWTQARMAAELGVSRQAVAKRLRRLGLRTSRGRPRAEAVEAAEVEAVAVDLDRDDRPVHPLVRMGEVADVPKQQLVIESDLLRGHEHDRMAQVHREIIRVHLEQRREAKLRATAGRTQMRQGTRDADTRATNGGVQGESAAVRSKPVRPGAPRSRARSA